MSRITTILTALAIAALPAAAQTDTGEYPYTGLIKADRVTIRTGMLAGGNNGVTRLSTGAEVIVVGKSGEWLKIKPPPGCFSIIPRYAVAKDADGLAGTVTELRPQPVFAGSNINSPPWPYQTRLSKGYRVQIVGEMTDEGRPFYKIAPPEGVYMYVLGQYVARKAGVSTGDPGLDPGRRTSEQPVVKDPMHPSDTGARPPVKPAIDPQMEAAIRALRETEAVLKSELAKPPAQQDLDGLRRRYQILKNDHGARLGDRIDAGIKAIDIVAGRRQQIQELEGRFKAVPLDGAGQIPDPVLTVKPGYTATGILSSSQVYEGSEAAYRKYAVHDRNDPLRIITYVQDPSGSIDLSRHIGKYVGIMGDVRQQAGSALTVVMVRSVTELGPGGLPQFPQPTISRPVEPAAEAPKPGPVDTEPKVPPKEPTFRAPEDAGIVEQPIVVEPPEAPETKPQPRQKPESRPAPGELPPTGFKIAPEEPTPPVNPEEYK